MVFGIISTVLAGVVLAGLVALMVENKKLNKKADVLKRETELALRDYKKLLEHCNELEAEYAERMDGYKTSLKELEELREKQRHHDAEVQRMEKMYSDRNEKILRDAKSLVESLDARVVEKCETCGDVIHVSCVREGRYVFCDSVCRDWRR